MKRITRDTVERITLDASLQRLGIVELEERLEFSPLLVEGGLSTTRGEMPTACCVCKIPDDSGWPDIRALNPATDGMGSTGGTDGGLIQ